MDADELAAIAVEVFGDDRVQVEPRLDDALEAAITLAEEEGGVRGRRCAGDRFRHHGRRGPAAAGEGLIRVRTLCASTLIGEFFVIGFAGLVAMKDPDLSMATVWTVSGVAMVLCLLLCGMITRPGGVQLGWALQIALIASGFVVPTMFFLGADFRRPVVGVGALRAEGGRGEGAVRCAGGAGGPAWRLPRSGPASQPPSAEVGGSAGGVRSGRGRGSRRPERDGSGGTGGDVGRDDRPIPYT